MAKTYFKELQEKIENLEDGFDIKNIEVMLLQSELTDALKPNLLLTKITSIHLEMLMEVHQYEKKHPSDRIKASKARLLNLLEMSEHLNSLSCKLQSLKLFNRELVTKIQLLRVENADMLRQLENIQNAQNF